MGFCKWLPILKCFWFIVLNVLYCDFTVYHIVHLLEIKTLKWSISRSVHLYQERGIRGQLQYVFQGFGGKIMHFQSGYAHKHVGSLAESLVIE